MGLACTFYAPAIVIQTVVITASVVAGLTAYTFWATRRGVEFTWMAPMLFSALWAMVIWGFLQIFFHPGPVAQTVYSLLGALLFCGYIVFDVHLLATRLDVDDYVWASVALYLVSQGWFLLDCWCCWCERWAAAAVGRGRKKILLHHRHAEHFLTLQDVINLFMYILRILGQNQNNN